jgi:hypothetical protein
MHGCSGEFFHLGNEVLKNINEFQQSNLAVEVGGIRGLL